MTSSSVADGRSLLHVTGRRLVMVVHHAAVATGPLLLLLLLLLAAHVRWRPTNTTAHRWACRTEKHTSSG